jgi:hypothetical protein
MYTATFTAAGQTTEAIDVADGDKFSATIGAGFTGEIIVESSGNGGHSWEEVKSYTAAAEEAVPGFGKFYRLRAKAISAGSSAVIIQKEPRTLEAVEAPDGSLIYAFDEDGVRVRAKGISGIGDAVTPRVMRSFGRTMDEGLAIMVIDEIIDVSVGGKTINLTNVVPQGAMLFSVQAHNRSGITAGGTSARVGLGDDSDPDKYKLYKKTIDEQGIADIALDGTPLAGDEQITVNACTTGGVLGDSDFANGTIRVRVVYFQIRDLESVAAA